MDKPQRRIEDLPADVVEWVCTQLPPAEAGLALGALAQAVDHTGAAAGDRLVRCAAVGSRGRLASLFDLVALLALDFRDVVVAGEYVPDGTGLRRVRDLTQPIGSDETGRKRAGS